ncbi:uncharacterized protein LOC123506070 [Portunus trituberculatus]|uniref:uncharacterized protein LOC123506070 n=1 Tax=Portunus trituberculatus TaxID=210409 RepID=UPI001E1CF441|nr:uncharacterized protein LOC123506070 [Portunus trituberculatus]XP_045113858.1 uncharacterized protein LOC123506070 [Portunus trituberculatus]
MGHVVIVMAVCYFSTWIEARPLKLKEAVEVSRFLYIICRHGCVAIQINDQRVCELSLSRPSQAHRNNAKNHICISNLQSRPPQNFHHSRCYLAENLFFSSMWTMSSQTAPPILTILSLRRLTSMLHSQSSRYYRMLSSRKLMPTSNTLRQTAS